MNETTDIDSYKKIARLSDKDLQELWDKYIENKANKELRDKQGVSDEIRVGDEVIVDGQKGDSYATSNGTDYPACEESNFFGRSERVRKLYISSYHDSHIRRSAEDQA